MNNEELIRKLQICVNEYQKLEKEKNKIELELEEERESNNHLQACLKESMRAIEVSKETLEGANNTIEEMTLLIDYYEKSMIMMFDNLTNKMQEIIDKKEIHEEEINTIKEEIEKSKKDLINLNKIII